MDCLNNVLGGNNNCACTWLIIAILAILAAFTIFTTLAALAALAALART